MSLAVGFLLALLMVQTTYALLLRRLRKSYDRLLKIDRLNGDRVMDMVDAINAACQAERPYLTFKELEDIFCHDRPPRDFEAIVAKLIDRLSIGRIQVPDKAESPVKIEE